MNDDTAKNVTLDMRYDVDQFRKNLWMIELLTTEAMTNPKKSIPHWREIFRETGFPEDTRAEDL